MCAVCHTSPAEIVFTKNNKNLKKLVDKTGYRRYNIFRHLARDKRETLETMVLNGYGGIA
jgi:hypothetical protein